MFLTITLNILELIRCRYIWSDDIYMSIYGVHIDVSIYQS